MFGRGKRLADDRRAMWRILGAVLLLGGCVDRTVVDRLPCQARIYGSDVSVEFDGTAQCAGRRLDIDPNTPGILVSQRTTATFLSVKACEG